MRYFLELSYNGANYHGWQKQPNAITVQEVLEKALSILLNRPIPIVGAGRTDAGVHAKQMYAHFDIEAINDTDQLVYKLNAFLPKDIAIHQLYKVTDNAHARFDAYSRTYLYRVSTKKNVFNIDQAYYFKPELNMDHIIEASSILKEYKDFECFSKVHTDVKTFNCNIQNVNWQRINEEWHFTITADRFLRNMVRAIVGTLLTIGSGKLCVDDMYNIINSKNRSKAGYSVPGHALYLTEILYPETIFNHD